MSNIAIKVENLGKLYRLGEVGTGTISHDLNRWWARMRGKEDPGAKIGETNDRTAKGNSDYVWSLKDVNFEVKQGEVLGIIGRNGAGKSTLLKLLSKVTTPTTGKIKVKGRIASLLEVGTGFHPELTGRENIFLNGAILGMTKTEIRSKFDEIVDFSGVERYIDTPVKRYSSGMYVRLAFAVSAFLEPEILIIDEVLAVGDAEFQKKCLGRMKDVSVNDGRTVLFVSHNMAAIQQLCTSGVLLKNGQLVFGGNVRDTLQEYSLLQRSIIEKDLSSRTDRQGTGLIKFTSIRFFDEYSQPVYNIVSGQNLTIKLEFQNNIKDTREHSVRFDLLIVDEHENTVSMLTTFYQGENTTINAQATLYSVTIPHLPLLEGNYNLGIYCKIDEDEADWIMNAADFPVEEGDYFNCGRVMPRGFGLVAVDHNIQLT
ncbi:ABC transporter ATP-binding protein [Hymenobacter volaticus]|uniref:ABC transporter ATP-binding protein n=1 Tax=Hymenobacter volaticus TaxID=2932254 RepID=A0ABY4G8I3_9BACT|nr:ABC transporter ATP-binding protein [Hymenobacter volaticus]UOQ67210.1 ABC transporter ATP-binding protein [Hymenobacter volaticus]